MVRQHPAAPSTIACIWPANNELNEEIAQRLNCWAGPENVNVSTDPNFHFEVPKALCGTNGPLTFTDGGPNQCPLGDDLTVSAADPIDPNTCAPPPAPGDTPATQEGNNVFTGTNTFEEDVTVNADLNLNGALNHTGDLVQNGNTFFTGDLDITGQTTHTGDLGVIGLLSIDGDISTSGDIGLPGTITSTPPDDQTSALLINQNEDVDPNTSADLLQINYKGERAGWFNEWGGLRIDVPPIADLGYSDVAVKLFEQADGSADGLQIFAAGDGSTPQIRSRGGIFFVRRLTADEYETAWTAITVDSPQTASKYTTNPNGTNNANSLQVQVFDYGRMARLRGRVNVVTTGGVTDEIFATTPPTSIALGTEGATVTAVPQRVRGFMAMGIGGGIRITISPNGNMQVIGSALTQAAVHFDSCEYSLEL